MRGGGGRENFCGLGREKRGTWSCEGLFFGGERKGKEGKRRLPLSGVVLSSPPWRGSVLEAWRLGERRSFSAPYFTFRSSDSCSSVGRGRLPLLGGWGEGGVSPLPTPFRHHRLQNLCCCCFRLRWECRCLLRWECFRRHRPMGCRGLPPCRRQRR